MRARVVITGLGLVTPLGDTVEGIWSSLLAGRSGISRVEEFSANGFPCRIAGVIPDFRPEAHIPLKEARRMARVSQVALVAAKKAVEDAALPLPLADPERVGVYIGTAMGGLDKVDEGIEIYRWSAPSVRGRVQHSALVTQPALRWRAPSVRGRVQL